ncbi:hypothetical protein ACFO5K_02315 [Nocardia halotolerans]|uniref:Mce-associated membrane protein n=1 Tax=Nocardia halotolerans TaxID=1755878 RepID=A0ABV8VCB1_9NOCA
MTTDLDTRDHEPTTDDARPRTLSLRLSTVLTGGAVVALLVAAAVFGLLYGSARSALAEHDRRAADDRRVEQLALDYALGASTIDYREVREWITRLKTGTTTQLSSKFDATAPQLEQILLPLQWTSTATPLSAGIVSESGGVYKVNAYLTVSSTSVQNPDGTLTTVAYSLTVDRNADWRIADVGGLQNAIPLK